MLLTLFGKSIIIYSTSDKIFTKTVINNKIENDQAFSMISLNDSTKFNFKNIMINR